eukprot:2468-Prymnesium_polylepis.1
MPSSRWGGSRNDATSASRVALSRTALPTAPSCSAKTFEAIEPVSKQQGAPPLFPLFQNLASNAARLPRNLA